MNRKYRKHYRKVVSIKNDYMREFRKNEVKIPFIITVITIIILVFLGFPTGYLVTIDGIEVGVIESKALIEESIQIATAQIEQAHGTEAQMNGDISYSRAKMFRRDKITANYLITYIRTNVEFLFEFYELYIDLDYVGIIQGPQTMDDLLERLKLRYYGTSYFGQVEFGNDILLVPKFTTTDKLMSFEDLMSRTTQTSSVTIDYEVIGGDTLLDIALNLGVSFTGLLNANPHLTADSIIAEGDIIQVVMDVPYVMVNKVFNGHTGDSEY